MRKFCSARGCFEITTESRCPAHQREAAIEREVKRRAERGTTSQRGYDTQWRKVVKQAKEDRGDVRLELVRPRGSEEGSA